MVDILSGAEHRQERSLGSAVTGHRFDLPDGNPVWVLWRRTDGSESVNVDDLLPPGQSVHAHDLFGKPVDISGRTLRVDESAIYLYSGAPARSP